MRFEDLDFSPHIQASTTNSQHHTPRTGFKPGAGEEAPLLFDLRFMIPCCVSACLPDIPFKLSKPKFFL